MFEVLDKMIKESTQVAEEDKEIKSVIDLFNSISEGDIPPQFLKHVKKAGGESEADEGDEKKDDKKDDDKKEDKKEDKVVDESTLIKYFDRLSEGDKVVDESTLIKYFDRLSEGDQEKLDKSDDADKGVDGARNGQEQGSDKSGSPKEGAGGEVKSDSGVKKDSESALVDWAFCQEVEGSPVAEADQLTQDHQVHKQGLRGAIGNANDGDGNKDDALPDSDDKEAKPETAKKLVDKSESVEVMQDWIISACE